MTKMPPKRARGDPIEYVRNLRLRVVSQFWAWFQRVIHPRRIDFSAPGHPRVLSFAGLRRRRDLSAKDLRFMKARQRWMWLPAHSSLSDGGFWRNELLSEYFIHWSHADGGIANWP